MEQAASIEPFAVAPGEGLAVENPVGGVTTFKAMADASGGALTALAGVAAPGEGPPLHLHRGQDELIYTLDGQFRVRFGDQVLDAPGGSFFFIPRDAAHVAERGGGAWPLPRRAHAGYGGVRAVLRPLRRASAARARRLGVRADGGRHAGHGGRGPASGAEPPRLTAATR